MQATWKAHEKHGELTERSDLPDSVFAFPKQRKEPMTDASHVRNAIARFDQTIGVSDKDRKLAFANIRKAAKHYGVDMSEDDWKELGRHPSTGRTAEDRSKSAQKAAATRKEENATSNTNDRTRMGVLRRRTPLALWAQAVIADFLRSAVPLVNAEPGTISWFAIQEAPSRFAIFDTFDDEAGREAHLNGKVAAAPNGES